ncbi:MULTISPECIES: helix-turn-helix domain-containing protein [Methylobacterium]|uniref:helix-turn-helix domain-containing protein n=1 Tax=Methylobacterium TaxID=407 RepID=UPI00272DCC33|nr:helix-turn-helix domain-containing protein [Methylobacterium sp.]
MPTALSVDLRRRVVAALEQGLSCAQVAERFGVSAASASRWRARLNRHGCLSPAAMGGDRRSVALEEHASVLLDQVAQTPDLTLAELKGRLSRRGIKSSLSAISRLLTRHGLTYKKRRRMRLSSSSRT